MKDLTRMMYLAKLSGEGKPSTRDLERKLGVKRRTIYKYVSDLRLMGAEVYSYRNETGRFSWGCRNWERIQPKVDVVVSIDRTRSLTRA